MSNQDTAEVRAVFPSSFDIQYSIHRLDHLDLKGV